MTIAFLFISFLLTLATAYPRGESYPGGVGRFQRYTQIGSDKVCYNVEYRTYPTIHRLEKSISYCETGIEAPNAIPFLTDDQPFHCPDPATRVVVFAPNNNDIEQNVSMDVYRTSVNWGYNTVLLIKNNATTFNFLSYARCPLVGLFYDGDADSQAITTRDGLVFYTDIAKLYWNYTVLSYWLACEAYNEPMLSAVSGIHPRKWAAGVNDLMIGPSDVVASVAFQAGLRGEPLEQSFREAVAKYDIFLDNWGYGGFGSDALRYV